MATIFAVSDSEKTDGNLYYVTNPCCIEIDGMNILLLLDHDPLRAIKKRFISVDNNDFLIDSVPDIILSNKDVNANYKSISIINEKCEIELRTRTIKKI
jgi:hypothetical protein